jgi:glycosyltransferase involved in cell wall biosynthesis
LQNLADVSLIPSRDEPFGLVVIEGTACGHPVIGSNSGGIPGILNTTKEKLEDKDIIKTDLGVLVKPLPVRPETLSAEQKDELDVISADYVIATPEERKEILKSAKEKFNLQDELEEYFSEYAKSTEALADATTQIVDKKLTFDDNYIAEYTKNNYSQDKIRDKLIGVYKEAKKLKKIKVLAD